MASKNKISDREIEEIYQEGTLRLSQERNDYLLPQVLDFVHTKTWINLHPEYQRRLVWDRAKKSLFIESLLMNVPIPPIFLFEWEYSRYEVMDGQQRLCSICDFYQNKFKLSGLERWPQLNGRNYDECPPIIQRGLDRRRISSVVILAEYTSFDQHDVRRLVFERLNTGGQNLNPQELRNCIYSGPFNNLLIELAGYDLFDDIWKIPRYSDNFRGEYANAKLSNNSLYKRMRDVEIVLRFFAFRKKSNIKGSVKTMLDNCMKENMEIRESDIQELRDIFLLCLTSAYELFGGKTFQLPDRSEPSQPMYDAIMITMERHPDKIDRFLQNSNKISKNLERELRNEEFYDLVVGRPNTAAAIKNRLNAVEKIFLAAIR